MGCGSSKAGRISVAGLPPPSARSKRSKKSRASVGFSDDVVASLKRKRRMYDVEEEETKSVDSVGLRSEEDETGESRRENELIPVHQLIAYVSTDKRVYSRGETVFVSVVLLDCFAEITGARLREIVKAVEPSLVVTCSASRLEVFRERVAFDGRCSCGFELRMPCEAPYGEYVVTVEIDDDDEKRRVDCKSSGAQIYVKEFHVKNFDIAVAFTAKAYGPGDTVEAFVKALVPSKQTMPASSSLTAVVQIDSKTIHESRHDLNRNDGTCFLAFQLPDENGPTIHEGFLNCQASIGGLTGFVKTPLPFEQNVNVTVYPESGYLVMGLECGVYFITKRKSGDTIDTSVVLEEHDVGQSDRVRIVSRASTSYEGRGKLVFKVRRGKAYRLRIVQPYGATGQCDLPSAKEGGMSIRSLDESPDGPIRLRLGSTFKSSYTIKAFLFERELSSLSVVFPCSGEADERHQEVALTIPSFVSGIVCVAAFTRKGRLCCKKRVYKRAQKLDVSVNLSQPKVLVSGCLEAGVTIATKESRSGCVVPSLVNVSVVDDSAWSSAHQSQAAVWMSPGCLDGNTRAAFALDFILSTTPIASTVPPSELPVKQKELQTKYLSGRCMLSFKRYAGRTTEKKKMLNDDTEQLRGSIQFKIWEALYSGNYKEIKHLSTQADLKEVQWNGENLLHRTIRFFSKTQPEICQKLLEVLVVDANLAPNEKRTNWRDENAPLHTACQSASHPNVITKLIALGASSNQQNGLGQTPLSVASSHGHLKAVQVLLNHHFRTSRQDERKSSRGEATLQERIGAPDGTGWTALHYASAGGHVAVLECLKSYAKLIGEDLDWNAVTGDGQHLSLLHCAARYIGAFSDSCLGSGVDQTIQYLLIQGATMSTDARGYSHCELKHLTNSPSFGALCRYGKQKKTRRPNEDVELAVKYRKETKLLSKMPISAEISTVLERAIKEHGLVMSLKDPIYFLVALDNECLLDEVRPCSAPVEVVRADKPSSHRLAVPLQIGEDVPLRKYLEDFVRANRPSALALASKSLLTSSVVRRSNFLINSSSFEEKSTFDFDLTPKEYGISPGQLIFIYNALLATDDFPTRRTRLSDYGICDTKARNPVELKLHPLDIKLNLVVQVITETPKPIVETSESAPPIEEQLPAPARPPTKKGGGKGKGKPATAKAAGGKKKGATGKPAPTAAPSGKSITLSMSAFESLMCAKKRLVDDLADYLLCESGLQFDDQTQSLEFRFYVEKRLVPDHVPIYATFLVDLPPSSTVVAALPLVEPRFFDLTRLFDFWTTAAWFEVNPDGVDAESDIESALAKASDSENGYRGDSGDSDADRQANDATRKKRTKKSARQRGTQPARRDSDETATTAATPTRQSLNGSARKAREGDDKDETAEETVAVETANEKVDEKLTVGAVSAVPAVDRQRRVRFFAWHSRWHKVMLRWGNDTLRGRTSALRWIVRDGNVLLEKLGDAGLALVNAGRFYAASGLGVVERQATSRCYSQDTFEDYESECGAPAREHVEQNMTSAAVVPAKAATDKDIVYVSEVRPSYKKEVSLRWEESGASASSLLCKVQRDTEIKGAALRRYVPRRNDLGNVPRSIDTLLWLSGVEASEGSISVFLPLREKTKGYRILVDAFSSLGVVGHADRLVEVQKHFDLKFDMPCCLCCGDKLASPVLVTNNSESRLSVNISSSVSDGKALTCRLRGEDPDDTEANSCVAIESGETQKQIMQIEASGNEVCKSTVRVSGKSGENEDGTAVAVTVTPSSYFYEELSVGTLESDDERLINIGSSSATNNGCRARLSIEFHESPMSILRSAIDLLSEYAAPMSLDQQATVLSLTSMLFERTKSSDVTVLYYRSLFGRLQRCFQDLLKFRHQSGGFSFFPAKNSSPDPVATAIAIQTLQVARKALSVETYLLDSAKDWLLSERRLKGKGYSVKTESDLFHPSGDLLTAYICWSMTEAGFDDKIIGSDVATVEDRFLESDEDPYALALICLSLYNAGDSEAGQQIAEKLVSWQKEDGRVAGSRETITQSNEKERDAEATCLAILCWLKGEEDGEKTLALKGVKWLLANLLSSQSYLTVLVLKTLFRYYENYQFKVSPQNESSGSSADWVVDAIIRDAPSKAVEIGKNVVEDLEPLDDCFPVHLAVKTSPKNQFLYYCVKYKTHLETMVTERKGLDLCLELSLSQIEIGSQVVIVATVKNQDEIRKPVVVCELGIPAGLQIDYEHFRSLCKSNDSVKAFEIIHSILRIFLSLDKIQEISFAVNATAAYAGKFTGQPSVAFLPSSISMGKVWAQPLKIEIGAPYLPIPPPPPPPSPSPPPSENEQNEKKGIPEEIAKDEKN